MRLVVSCYSTTSARRGAILSVMRLVVNEVVNEVSRQLLQYHVDKMRSDAASQEVSRRYYHEEPCGASWLLPCPILFLPFCDHSC